MAADLTDPRRSQLPPSGTRIAEYASYQQAQRAVDFLSDNEFPVEQVTIVGTDLQLVERVTGRLTYPRVALAGAAAGAWFGLMLGILLSLFSQGGTWQIVGSSVATGMAFGIMFYLLQYAFRRGQPDFTSTSQVIAAQYAVLCDGRLADQARSLLSKLPGNHGVIDEAPAPPSTEEMTSWPAPTGEPVQQTPPKLRTYGEMLDLQKKAQEQARHEPADDEQPRSGEQQPKTPEQGNGQPKTSE